MTLLPDDGYRGCPQTENSDYTETKIYFSYFSKERRAHRLKTMEIVKRHQRANSLSAFQRYRTAYRRMRAKPL